MKTILILGGFGFLGTNIMKYIDEKFNGEWSVIVFDKYSSHPYGNRFRCIDKVYASDFSDINTLHYIFAHHNVDYIIHSISTTTPNSSQDAVYDIESNLIPTVRLLNLMVQFNVKDIVFVSSGGAVYGDNMPGIAYKETDEVFPRSSYGVTKLAIEKYMFQYADLYGIRPLILRLSNPYGKYHYSVKQGVCNVALRCAIEHIPFSVWGDGKSQKDYIFVNDFCDIMFKLILKRIHTTVINIASGQIVSLSSILEIVKNHIKDFQWSYVNSSKYDITNVKLDNSKLLGILEDYKFTTLDDGMNIVVNWLKR